MIAALLGVIVLAVVLAYEDHDTPGSSLQGAGAPGVPGVPGAAGMPGRWWGDGFDDYASLGPDELFRMMPSDEPIDTEPADLPAYTPKDHEPAPVREQGFRRRPPTGSSRSSRPGGCRVRRLMMFRSSTVTP